MPERPRPEHRPRREERKDAQSYLRSVLEYKELRKLFPSPKITVFQFFGGRDASAFEGFPTDEVYLIDPDESANVIDEYLESHPNSEHKRLAQNPVTHSHPETKKAHVVALRNSHVPRAATSQFYQRIYDDLHDEGIVITSNTKRHLDAAELLKQGGFELEGIIQNAGTNKEPELVAYSNQNEEGKTKLKEVIENIHKNKKRKKKIKDEEQEVDEYAETTFIFRKKAPEQMTQKANTNTNMRTPAATAVAHTESAHTPLPAHPEGSRHDELQKREPHTPEPAPQPEPPPNVQSETPKKEEKNKPSSTETWFSKQKKAVLKSLENLGFTVGGELWTTTAAMLSTAGWVTGNPAFFLAAIAPSAIGGLVNYEGIRGSQSALEKLWWWTSHFTASTGLLFPISNVSSAISKFIGRQRRPPVHT